MSSTPATRRRASGRIFFTALIVLLVLLGIVVAAGFVVASRIPDEAALAQRLAERLEKALGVPVTVGAVHWQLLPGAQVVVTDVVATPSREQIAAAIARRSQEELVKSGRQPGPAARDAAPEVPPDASQLSARIQRITLWPRLWPLVLHGEIGADRVSVEGARLPQLLLTALGGKHGAAAGAAATPAGSWKAGGWHLAPQPLARLDFSDVEWIGRHDKALRYEGSVDFDPAWRPRHAQLVRTGAEPPARLLLERQNNEDRWAATIAVAGGSMDGTLALQAPPAENPPGKPTKSEAPVHPPGGAPANVTANAADGARVGGTVNGSGHTTTSGGAWRLSGDFLPKNIELAKLLSTFDRHTVVSGTLNGSTHLESQAGTAGGLVSALTTRTQFRIAPATIQKFDLEKAIHTLGIKHDGSTRLDVLEGRLDTHSSPRGMVLHYSDIHATAGKLSAHGEATLQDRHIDAQFTVDLVDGVVGVPLKVSGPVSDPSYSVPASALAKADSLPNVGSAIGARIGNLVERVFGGDDTGAKKAPAPVPPGTPAPVTTRP